MSVEQRAAFPLELRQIDERTLSGICVPWNETTHLAPDPGGERFLPGSLTRTVRERGARLKLFHGHDYAHAIGAVMKLDPKHPDGLWGEWRIFDTVAGNDALAEIEQRALDMFSVGFAAVKTRRAADGVREIVEAAVHEVSLTPLGAYDGARVLATRSVGDNGEHGNVTELQKWMAEHPAPALHLTQPGPLRRDWPR